MRRLGLVLAVLGLLLAAVGSASAAGAKDKFVGSGSLLFNGQTRLSFTVSAHSGPAGQDASGFVRFDLGDLTVGRASVECLAVQGNRAIVYARLDRPQDFGAVDGFFYLQVDDSGPGQPDVFQVAGFNAVGEPLPPLTGCRVGTGVSLATFDRGNFVVTDAP